MGRQTRVLVLEDQMMLAFALKSLLGENDIDTLGPFADAQSALEAIEEEEFEFALLDINLGDGKTSAPVADALVDMKKPFVFVTGYGSGAPLPPRFDHVERLTKPIRMELILEVIERDVAP